MPTISVTLPADGDDAIVEPYNAALLLIQSVLNGGIDTNNLAAGAVTLADLSSTIAAALVPTGAINAFGGSTAPSGWLVCDGSSYLRASFSSLFAVVGTAYGSADGTHFNVPDLRGRVAVGIEIMGGSSSNRIERTSTITTTSGSNSATVGSATNLSEGMIIKSTNVPTGTTITGISGTTITMSANASANGTTIAARFSMVSDAEALGGAGGFDVTTLSANQMPIHNHVVASFPNGAGGGGAPLNSGNTGTQSNPGTTNAGGSQAHGSVQPSLIVNYLIKT